MSVDGVSGEVQPIAASMACELFNCNVSLYIGSVVCTVSHDDISNMSCTNLHLFDITGREGGGVALANSAAHQQVTVCFVESFNQLT